MSGDYQLYHGTSAAVAQAIAADPWSVTVTKGGGELGRGFYAGTHLYRAAIWARLRHPSSPGVLGVSISSTSHDSQRVLDLDRDQVRSTWAELKRTGRQQTHAFGVDIVTGPFATLPDGRQHKFESPGAELLLRESRWKIE